MQLSPHFHLAEFTSSQTAERRGIVNRPSPAIVENLKLTAAGMEQIRRVLGLPISISSGYRSPLLNEAVGGSPTSDHMEGLAADFICPAFGSPLKICHAIVNAGIVFDQLIEEGTWVHVSFPPRGERGELIRLPRMQVLTKAKGGGYSKGLRHL